MHSPIPATSITPYFDCCAPPYDLTIPIMSSNITDCLHATSVVDPELVDVAIVMEVVIAVGVCVLALRRVI